MQLDLTRTVSMYAMPVQPGVLLAILLSPVKLVAVPTYSRTQLIYAQQLPVPLGISKTRVMFASLVQ